MNTSNKKVLMTIKEGKKKSISQIAAIGRKYKILKYPILLFLILFIFVYNFVYYFCKYFKLKERTAKAIAMAMCVILCVTSIDITAFAFTGEAGSDKNIAGISSLSDEIANQKVGMDATLEDIEFPESLDVHVTYLVEKEIEVEAEEEEITPTPPTHTPSVEPTPTVEPSSITETTPKEEPQGEEVTPSEEINEEDNHDSNVPEQNSPIEEQPEENGQPENTQGDDTESQPDGEQVAKITGVEYDNIETVYVPMTYYAAEPSKEEVVVETLEKEDSEDEPGDENNNDEAVHDGKEDGAQTEPETDSKTVTEKETVIEEVEEDASVSVEWSIDEERSSKTEFKDLEVGEKYIFVPTITEDGYKLADDVELPVITVTVEENVSSFEQSVTVDGVVITVTAEEGVFPEGACVSARKVSRSEENKVTEAIDEVRDNNKNVALSYTFDIMISDKDGNEIEPDTEKGSVKVSFKMAEIANSNLETEVYHVEETDGGLNAESLGTSEEAGDEVVVETDGFSYYTVEFTYGELQYVLPGDSRIELTTILDTIGIDVNGEITEVIGSNDSLFKPVNEDGTWYIEAVTAFTSTEWLKVKIGEVEYEIIVTDAINYQHDIPGDSDSNNVWSKFDFSNGYNNITLTFSEDGTKLVKIKYDGRFKYTNSSLGDFFGAGFGISANNYQYSHRYIFKTTNYMYADNAINDTYLDVAYDIWMLQSHYAFLTNPSAYFDSNPQPYRVCSNNRTRVSMPNLTRAAYQFPSGDFSSLSFEYELSDADNQKLDPNKTYYVSAIIQGWGVYNPARWGTIGSTSFKLNEVDTFRYSVNFDYGGIGSNANFTLPVMKNESVTNTKTDKPNYEKWSTAAQNAVTNWDTVVVSPTATGYSFGGWYTDSGCTSGHEYDFASSVSKDITLYAKWTPNTYTVTLDAQEGTGGTDTVTATYDATMPTATMPTRTGYTFSGYFDATTGGTQYYAANGSSVKNWDKAANATLYAKWTADQYTITYKDKGGSSFSGTHASDAPTTHTYGTNTTLKNPSKTGYDFGGWFESSDCSGTAKTSLGATEYTTGITLYAKWTEDQYAITYKDKGGGDFSGTHEDNHPTTHIYGTATSLKGASKTGYTFGGWYTSQDCSGTAITSLGANSYTEGITLYAKWSPITYMIHYDGNGNTGGATANSTHVYDSSSELNANEFTKTGYSFAGWATTASGNVVYANSQSIMNLSSTDGGIVTLYAKWTANQYTITYKDKDDVAFSGTHESGYPTTHTYGMATTLKGANKANYTFVGWYTSSDCSGDAITSLGATAYTGNITLYAKWIGKHQVTAPTALNPTYNGSAQGLISAGSCTTGTIKYSLDGTNYYESIDSIKKKEVGSYTVYYKVEGDGNYETYGPKTIKANIVKEPDPTPTPTPKPDPKPTPSPSEPDPQPNLQPTIPVTSTIQYAETGNPIKNYVANNPTGSNIPLPYITTDASMAGWKTIDEALDAHKAKYKKNAVGTLNITMNGSTTVDTKLITDAHEKKIPLSFALDDEVAIGIPVVNTVLSNQAKEGKTTYFKVSSMTTAEAVSVKKAHAGLLPSDIVAIGGDANTPVVLTFCSNDKLSTKKSQLMTITFNAKKAGFKKGDKVYLYCGTAQIGIAMYKTGKVDKNGFVTFSVPMVSNYWTIGSKNMKNKLLRNAVALPR